MSPQPLGEKLLCLGTSLTKREDVRIRVVVVLLFLFTVVMIVSGAFPLFIYCYERVLYEGGGTVLLPP